MEIKYKETHKVKYNCGCVHEIGLPETGFFWEHTGNDKDCGKVH